MDSGKVVSLHGVKLERLQSTDSSPAPVLSTPCSQSPVTGSSNLVPSPVISSVTTNTSKSSAHCPACKTSSRSANQLLYSLIAEKPDVCLLPKENNNEERKESRHVHEPDKNDSSDQVMSCDKNVVNHIIDKLFTRDSSAQPPQKPLTCEMGEKRMSHSQVEAVVKERLKAMSAPQSIEECMTKIITEAYATQIQGDLCRDKQPVVSKSNSENSLMSQMLRTGTYRAPGKVPQESKESVVKSPPSFHTSSVSAIGTRFVKPDPVVWGKSMEARMRLPKKRPYPGDIDCSDSNVSDDGQISPMVSPSPSTADCVLSPVCSDTASSTSPRYDSVQYSATLDSSGSAGYGNKWSEVLSKDYDKLESNNSRATRKSKRRNRGQRYMELINEGIIQPSKERLAAIRTESLSSVDDR